MNQKGFSIRGQRVTLREVEPADWEDIHLYASQEIVCQYQPWGTNSEEETRLYVDKIISDTQEVPRTRFAMAIVRNSTRRLIGVGEINVRSIHHKNGEIAYIIHPNLWRQGFATEVAKLLIEFGFSKLDVHRIYATCDTRNIGSSKVLEKAGMSCEGTLRQNLLIKSGWRDSKLYSIIKNEWQE
jgi:RimJ/RimL family protein N-acetyltransferase